MKEGYFSKKTRRFLIIIYKKYVKCLRLNELSRKSEEEVVNIENLSSILKQLNNLPEHDNHGKNSAKVFSTESDLILEELENAKKNSDLNRARLEYLQVIS